MGKRPLIFLVLLLVLAACGAGSARDASGPRLVSEVTLATTVPIPTRILTATPTPLLGQSQEIVSPLEVVTLESDFVLVTPTLPPSKTPTQTPTVTQTPTQTRTPTVTVTATATALLFPTSIVIPVTSVAAQPLPQVCDSTWFFIQPPPENCPLSAPLAGQGVFQEFQNGFMIWVGMQDTIYVMYNDSVQPRWQAYNDQFEEGMAEDDPAYSQSPYPDTWQPRRGFGMLWRNNSAVRERIGWAIQQWEEPFSVNIQRGSDGSTFISAPDNSLFTLTRGGSNWQRFMNATGF